MTGQQTNAAQYPAEWGGETGRSWNSQQQAKNFTTYERDGNGNDQVIHRSNLCVTLAR